MFDPSVDLRKTPDVAPHRALEALTMREGIAREGSAANANAGTRD